MYIPFTTFDKYNFVFLYSSSKIYHPSFTLQRNDVALFTLILEILYVVSFCVSQISQLLYIVIHGRLWLGLQGPKFHGLKGVGAGLFKQPCKVSACGIWQRPPQQPQHRYEVPKRSLLRSKCESLPSSASYSTPAYCVIHTNVCCKLCILY